MMGRGGTTGQKNGVYENSNGDRERPGTARVPRTGYRGGTRYVPVLGRYFGGT
jgi:hypothetical protein